MIDFFKSLFRRKTEDEMILLARKSLCSVEPSEHGFRDLNEVQMAKIYLDAKKISEFQSFHAMLDDLKCRQRDAIAKNATCENIQFARGVLDGIEKVSETVRVFSERAMTKKDSYFNPHDII